ncbi:MAG: Dynein intermediate chain 2, axonemal [Marteilia pararefringens]
MEIVKVYTKKRSEFGKFCRFSENHGVILNSHEIEEDSLGDRLEKSFFLNSRDGEQRSLCESSVNTNRAICESHGMSHTEGGWPKDIATDDSDQTKRYRKKVEKDEGFVASMFLAARSIEKAIVDYQSLNIYSDSNNVVDVEQICDTESSDFLLNALDTISIEDCELSSIKIACGIADPNKIALAINKKSEEESEAGCLQIYNLDFPEKPPIYIEAPERITALSFNPKDFSLLLVGTENGRVSLIDIRKCTTVIDYFTAHKSEVTALTWLQTKNCTEFISGSLEGRLKQWNYKKPLEIEMDIDCKVKSQLRSQRIETPARTNGSVEYEEDDGDGLLDDYVGTDHIEHESTMASKFLISTNCGAVLLANKKAKSAADVISSIFCLGEDHIIATRRNAFNPKFFLSFSDNKVSIWSEDTRDAPIITLKKQSSPVVSCFWSPTRPSVLYSVLKDGHILIYDMMLEKDMPFHTFRAINGHILETCITSDGKYLIVIDSGQRITIFEIAPSLYISRFNEKQFINNFFERESKKEKIFSQTRKYFDSRQSFEKTESVELDPQLGNAQEIS